VDTVLFEAPHGGCAEAECGRVDDDLVGLGSREIRR
jgi:hypothetical protein